LPIINEETINKLLEENNINTTYEELSKEPYLFQEYKDIAYEDFIFKTPSGKIEIYSEQMKEWGEDPLPSYSEPLESKCCQNKSFTLFIICYIGINGMFCYVI
jgi:anaerobic selenocysteine-containing dehydrogenase